MLENVLWCYRNFFRFLNSEVDPSFRMKRKPLFTSSLAPLYPNTSSPPSPSKPPLRIVPALPSSHSRLHDFTFLRALSSLLDTAERFLYLSVGKACCFTLKKVEWGRGGLSDESSYLGSRRYYCCCGVQFLKPLYYSMENITTKPDIRVEGVARSHFSSPLVSFQLVICYTKILASTTFYFSEELLKPRLQPFLLIVAMLTL